LQPSVAKAPQPMVSGGRSLVQTASSADSQPTASIKIGAAPASTPESPADPVVDPHGAACKVC
jgi:hypothetical protein